MSNIFNGVIKYAGKWDVVGESKLDAQDLAELEPMATIVTKITHYQMFIPADSEVELPIGSKVPITDIIVVELHKDGEKNIQRCRVEEKPL